MLAALEWRHVLGLVDESAQESIADLNLVDQVTKCMKTRDRSTCIANLSNR